MICARNCARIRFAIPGKQFLFQVQFIFIIDFFLSNSLPTVADEATTTPDADEEAAEFAANFG